jgi:uncharacterized protein (TIGR00730 family)
MERRAVQSPSPGSAEADQNELLLARVQAELKAGFEALGRVEHGVSVFGSARTQPGDPEYELARAVAARLGGQGFAIITGGGKGIMEAANRGARDASALSIGLVIELPVEERINSYLDVPLRFHYFFTRKLMFVRYASAFVIFPGGLGTLDEVFELAALVQTGKVRAPPIVLVDRAYWRPLIDWLRDTVERTGKISSGDLGLFAFADTEEEIVACVSDAAGRI